VYFITWNFLLGVVTAFESGSSGGRDVSMEQDNLRRAAMIPPETGMKKGHA
jgi:hypothetical protein